MRLGHLFVILAAAGALSACATMQAMTSGQIGCPEHEIEILNVDRGFATRTWTARCRGRLYHCSEHGGGQYAASQVSCNAEPAAAGNERRTAPPAAPAPVGGCSYDTQCKGDRICVAGRCTSP